VLFLDRRDVAALLPMDACIEAVAQAFASHARRELPAAPGCSGRSAGPAAST
jgi:ornithine cyclodeaminase/alanine dehydrogenase-like protein (mu-crystallin family)